jgi:hypothetical protein
MPSECWAPTQQVERGFRGSNVSGLGFSRLTNWSAWRLQSNRDKQAAVQKLEPVRSSSRDCT